MKTSILPQNASITKGIILLAISSLAIYICYFYIDKDVAFWIHDQKFDQWHILKGFTQIIEVLVVATTLFYVYFIWRFFYQKVSLLDEKLLTIANSLVLTAFFKDLLKFIFGRYWTLTWTHGNPSLIEHNAYGFHFFHGGTWYQSFPSGHTALMFASMTALWILFPRLRWLSVTLCFLTVVGILGMNYHFVSDIIAGAVLGYIVGYCTTQVMQPR